MAAGLGGGSSDAAAVLKGMNDLFSLGLEVWELESLGKQVGADVPFFIRGGTALAEGIGEVLTELPGFKGINIILVMPKLRVSTPWVYKNLDLGAVKQRPDTEALLNAMEKGDVNSFAGGMVNVLETVTLTKYPVIGEIKHRLMELGALGSMMSGSGPSVFGIFKDKPSARRAYDMMRSRKWSCYLTQTI